MPDRIPLILWLWAAASPLLFRFLPGRDAAIACLIAGWAILPTAEHPPSATADEGRSSMVHALAVPTSSAVNKATAIGLGCLVGLIAFDREAFGRVRFHVVDLPMAALCLVPLASTLANGLPLSEGLAQGRYLTLAWGVPYFLGRAYLSDEGSRGRFAVALTAGGLAYLPLCALEFFTGPAAYRVAYGLHPYEFEGSARLLGNRPLGFMEHGNQLGIWMASSALVATWLWGSGANRRPGGVPGGIVSAALIAATVLCQSHAAIVLLGLGLVPLAIARVPRRRSAWRWWVLAVVGLAAMAVAFALAGRGLGGGRLREVVGGLFKGMGKSSFTWRLARAEDFLPVALRRPWLGWGRPDWQGDGRPFLNPVNLPAWLLALGMYGSVGLLALIATWLLPLARAWRFDVPRSWARPSGGATGALVALVTINLLDGLSNASAILPVLAALGGLNRPIDPSNPPRPTANPGMRR